MASSASIRRLSPQSRNCETCKHTHSWTPTRLRALSTHALPQSAPPLDELGSPRGSALNRSANKLASERSPLNTLCSASVRRNLGKNLFAHLPTKGLQNIRQIKTFGNPDLKEFPEPEEFPKVHTLALSYAYHCCQFQALKQAPTYKPPTSLQETIVWLQKEDVDMSIWSTNTTDTWSGAGDNSTKMAEFLNTLWKTYGKDYPIPDNIAQYAEEYFEDYKAAITGDENAYVRYPVQCLPQPSE